MLLLLLTAACAHTPMKVYTCKADGEVRKLSLPRDCRAFYATEVATGTAEISASLDGLANLGGSAGVNLSQSVTQLTEQLDQLNTMYRDTLATVCAQQHLDPCGLSPAEARAQIEAINAQFLQARLEAVRMEVQAATERLQSVPPEQRGAGLQEEMDEHVAAMRAELAAARESLLGKP